MTNKANMSEQDRKDFWGRGTEPNRLGAILRHASPGARLLDYGCGHGAYVRTLCGRGYDAVGADIFSYESWPEAEREIARGPRFHRIEENRIPFPDKEFEVSFAFEVLEHCPDPAANLAELVRVTRGWIIASVPDCRLDFKLRRHDLVFAHWTDQTHVNFFTPETFRAFFEDHGLAVESIGPAYEIDLHRAFWAHVAMNTMLKKVLMRLTKRRELSYHSSILAVARVG